MLTISSMQRVSLAVSAVAVTTLAVGGFGMAQAAPHDEHTARGTHEHGSLGEDRALQRSGDNLSALTKLRGKVNDNRVMTLSNTSPSPGRYRIIIRDTTKRHNWHIFGSGVNKETSVRGTGRWSWKVRLRSGTYTVVCDPHARSMRFSVIVS